MPVAASQELLWLAAVTALTGVLWLPHVLAILFQNPVRALTNPSGAIEIESQWAQRSKRAHANAVENLVIFAPLAILVHILQAGDGLTALAAMIYFHARVAHYVIYTLGIPTLRTIAFLTGVACQAVLALRLFGLV